MIRISRDSQPYCAGKDLNYQKSYQHLFGLQNAQDNFDILSVFYGIFGSGKSISCEF